MAYELKSKKSFLTITHDDGRVVDVSKAAVKLIEKTTNFVLLVILKGDGKHKQNEKFYGYGIEKLNYKECTNPVFSSSQELYDMIKDGIELTSCNSPVARIADKFDDTSVAGVTFVGYALPGTTSDTDSTYAIMRVSDTDVLYPDGVFEYTYKWSDRLTLTYEMRKF